MPADARSGAGEGPGGQAPDPGPPEAPPPAVDDLLAVVAHSLLSSVAVIVGGTELLDKHWADLPEAQRSELLASMRHQARHVAGVLEHLLRLGGRPLVEVLGALQDGTGDPGRAPAG